jgi:hypothetical protein
VGLEPQSAHIGGGLGGAKVEICSRHEDIVLSPKVGAPEGGRTGSRLANSQHACRPPEPTAAQQLAHTLQGGPCGQRMCYEPLMDAVPQHGALPWQQFLIMDYPWPSWQSILIMGEGSWKPSHIYGAISHKRG